MIAAHVRREAPTIVSRSVRDMIERYAEAMNQRELQWQKDMEVILDKCAPQVAETWLADTDDRKAQERLREMFGSKEFLTHLAAFTVIRTAHMAGRELSGAEIAEKANVIKDVFPVYFSMISAFLQKLATPNRLNIRSKKKKHWNLMCDCSLCLSIGTSHEIDGAEIYFVTGDKAIRNAATVAGCSERVLTLADYLGGFGSER